jgi:hypothetical protein
MTHNFGLLCNQRNQNNRTNILFGRNKFRKVQWTDTRPFLENLRCEERDYRFFQQDGALQ